MQGGHYYSKKTHISIIYIQEDVYKQHELAEYLILWRNHENIALAFKLSFFYVPQRPPKQVEDIHLKKLEKDETFRNRKAREPKIGHHPGIKWIPMKNMDSIGLDSYMRYGLNRLGLCVRSGCPCSVRLSIYHHMAAVQLFVITPVLMSFVNMWICPCTEGGNSKKITTHP